MSEQKAYNQRLIEEFRASREQAGVPLDGRPLLLLTTTGAQSGHQRVTPLMYFANDQQLVVFASNMGSQRHPDWYHNLVAHPIVALEVGNETYQAYARIAIGEEREQIWAKALTTYPFLAEHQLKTDRLIPVVIFQRREG